MAGQGWAWLGEVGRGGAWLGWARHGMARRGVADPRGADLGEADLYGADLHGADLGEADLHTADLRGASLGGASLGEATLNWNSHDLVAEILRRAAGEDPERRKIAGFVLVSHDWCWRQFLALDDPLREWALGVLRSYVHDKDGAPAVLARMEGESDE